MPDYTLHHSVIQIEKEDDVFPNFIFSGPPLPDNWRALKALCRFGTKEGETNKLFFRVHAYKPSNTHSDGTHRREIQMVRDFCFEVDPLEIGSKVMLAMSGHKEDCVGQWLGHEVIYDEKDGKQEKVRSREYILESFYLFRLNKSQLRHVQDAKRAVENICRHKPVNGEIITTEINGSLFSQFENLNGVLDNLRSFLMEPTPFMGFRLYPVRSKKKKEAPGRYPNEFTFYLGSMNAQDILTACKIGLQGYGIRFVGPLRVYEREGFRVSLSTGNLDSPLNLDQEQRLYLRHSAQCFVESGVSRVPKIANMNGLKVMPLMESETRDRREIMLVNIKGRTAPLTAADAAKLFVIV
jgi:hypothetical protein